MLYGKQRMVICFKTTENLGSASERKLRNLGKSNFAYFAFRVCFVNELELYLSLKMCICAYSRAGTVILEAH